METECGFAPLAQLTDNVKDSIGSVEDIVPEESPLQFQATHTNISVEANGVVNDEGSTYLQTYSDKQTNIIVRDDAVTQVLEALPESLAVPLDTEETVKQESDITMLDDTSVQLASTHNDVPDVLLEITTMKDEMLGGAGVLAKSKVMLEAGGPVAINMQMNVILDPEESGAELGDLVQATGVKNTSDLLTQIQSHNTEFSESLPSHTVHGGGDNNNFETPEVLNKKELLDILEGNEPESECTVDAESVKENKLVEQVDDLDDVRLLALQQLNSFQSQPHKNGRRTSRLPNEPKNPRGRPRKSHYKISHKFNMSAVRELDKQEIEAKAEEDANINKEQENQANKSKDLIKVLVEDWDDDDIKDESLVEQPNAMQSDDAATSILHSDIPETPYIKPNMDEVILPESISLLPKRRMSRVIKKKIIFDPDNPQTFTSKKTMVSTKIKSPQANTEQLEQPPPKKTKAAINTQKTKPDIKAKEKSLIAKGKTQWKKPPPKNSKHNRRLTEVDRLLMDEGAVNMMYQLNASGESETPKGKKNIRSKAAFIKRINQNPLETNEIKFRERKKESARVEDTARQEGSRMRLSTSNSAPTLSPAPESFETHNADDSIIIRRHSSSSYSSSCLSPRRLSDIDLSTSAIPALLSSIPANISPSEPSADGDKFNEVFMSAVCDVKKPDIFDKNDCLSLKEKLNSKLSRVLNVKRKRENKTDSKQKKFRESNSGVLPALTKLSIKFEDRIAEIVILKEGNRPNSVYNIDTLQELTSVLEYIETRSDVSVTLLLSENGDLCGGLDLNNIRQHKSDSKLKHKAASDVANAVRSLFITMERHSKFVCAGVEGACVGTGLALLALCDVVLASDRATFRLLAGEGELPPAVAVLTSHRKSLCRSLITEMLVFGRQLSASEALSRGLVSRTLWPDRFTSELRAMVRDIAAQPPDALQLKKKLLGLRNSVEQPSTLLRCLDAERELLSDYWSAAHYQDVSQSAD